VNFRVFADPRRNKAAALHDRHRGIEENLIGILGQVLRTAQEQSDDDAFGRLGRLRQPLSERADSAKRALLSAF
jgi:hypothetical protein